MSQEFLEGLPDRPESRVPGEDAAVQGRGDIMAQTRLPPELASAGVARRFVDWALRGTVKPADIEVAVLLASEVVANAVLHARTSIDLVIRNVNGCVQVEASDAETTEAVEVDGVLSSESGRGLTIVSALSEEWGVIPTSRGKTVWFRCYPAGP